ncbi:MAG: LytR family transcriptional regulator [Ruminococcaceae bacterium]|nr:LytR family transcriptional regulator [Oscillospiraceae bacterium]
MKKYFIALSLIAVSLFGVLAMLDFPSSHPDSRTVNIDEDGTVTFLCAGFDYVGSNTDSLILVSANTKEKSLKFLQIPRDTFISGETSNGKINNLYSSYYQEIGNHNSAMQRLKNTVSGIFALPVDYYFSLNLDTLSNAVDKMGGVEIDVPYDMKYLDAEQNLDISIKKGKQVLNGKKALDFVRYRVGYVEGDIGRVDAQKIFLSALLNTAKEKLSIPTAVSIIRDCLSNGSTDMSNEFLLSFAVKMLGDASQYEIYYMTLPGEAAKDTENGLSYYAVNRASAIDMLSAQGFDGFEKIRFDAQYRLLKKNSLTFSNIYYAPKLDYSVYTDEDIKNLNINIKS